jgi:hypothetical protein
VCVVTDLEASLTVLIYPGINGADSFALQFGNVLDYAAPRFSEPASQFLLRARAKPWGNNMWISAEVLKNGAEIRSPSIHLNPYKNQTALVSSYMPMVIREGGFEVRMFYDDHPPPHAHVVKAGSEVRVNLITLM